MKIQSPQVLPIGSLGELGVITDRLPHVLPPQAWTEALNVTFDKNGVTKRKGHSATLATPSITPVFLTSIAAVSTVFWIYTTLTKAYVYESGVETNFTRQSAGVDVNYTVANPNEWDATILGGVLLLNNATDPPQYWPGFSVATKLADLTNWPSNTTCKALKAFGNYLVALNITESGTNKPHMVWWSHKADPGTIPSSWDYSNAAVDAGRFELTDIEGGALLDGLLLGDRLIMYKESSTHALRFVGGNDIMAPELLLTTSGILAKKCACAFDKGTKHFVATRDDIIVHAGTRESKSVADDRVRSKIFNNIDPTNYINSFTFDNAAKKECWFVYPEAGNTYPNKAAIWNYKDDTWSFREFNAVSVTVNKVPQPSATIWSGAGTTWDTDATYWSTDLGRQTVFLDRTKPKFYALDQTNNFDTTPTSMKVVRQGLAIDRKDLQGNLISDIHTVKLWSRIWPKITGATSTLIKVGYQDNHNDVVNWVYSEEFNPKVLNYIDPMVSGRLMAISFENFTNEDWRLEGFEVEVTKLSDF